MKAKLTEKNIRGGRGVSIYLAVLIMSILLAIVLGMNAILIGQIKTIREIGYSVAAFFAAETGIERALNDKECTTTCEIADQELDLGGGQKAYYTIKGYYPAHPSCDSEAFYCIISTGSFGGVKRAIQVTR